MLVLAEPRHQGANKPEHGENELIHFIWLTQPGSRPFSFINALAIRAAATRHYADDIIMWCNEVPRNNPNWHMVQDLFEVRPIEMPSEIDGIPLEHIQYKADVLRLQILQKHGGIYLDTDTLLLKRLHPLVGPEMVLARETSDSLGMSPIIAKPNADFINVWLQRIPAALEVGTWAYHSVNLPVEISKYHFCDIRPQAEFFPFDLRHNYLFDDGRADEHTKRLGDPYALHVYETYWAGYIDGVDESYMRTRDTLFARLFRDLV
jgi:hypothetical protein